MRVFFASVLLGIVPSLTFAKDTQLENSLRASKEKVDFLIDEIQRLKSASNNQTGGASMVQTFSEAFTVMHLPPDCDPNSSQACVPNCVSRGSNGTCYSYGSDFCAPHAACAPNCISRGSNGTCYSYSSDFCGSNANCAEKCISRGSNGTCYNYTADHCGIYAHCTANCLSRGSNGTCYNYGADICY